MENVRDTLDRLIRDRGEDYAALSRLIGRNPAYIQQFIRRGSPRRLAENDRKLLARYLGVDESLLGGPAPTPAAGDLIAVPRLAVEASAGPGALANREDAVSRFRGGERRGHARRAPADHEDGHDCASSLRRVR